MPTATTRLTRPLPGLIAVLALTLAGPLAAETRWPAQGWEVRPSEQAYPQLLDALRSAVEAQGMAVVTEAGPTEAAAARGIEIPGNRVLGVFRNDFAVRLLEASVPAMIEAPMRFYVTENEDGGATLAWKRPSHLLAPYVAEGGEDVEIIAEELDRHFEAIGEQALSAP